MYKKCKLIECVSENSKASSSRPHNVTNWKLCVICQQTTSEKLVDPGQNQWRGNDKQCGFKMLALNISEFQNINCVPLDLDISRLDYGEGIEANLKSNGAVWHKSCRNRFDNQKLQRAKKRKARDQSEFEHSPVRTRQSSTNSMTKIK